MKAVHVSPQPGYAGQTLFATSFGVSLLIHGLVFGWMLSGSGSARSLLSDAPSFHTVSLVDAPMMEPQAIAGPSAIPEAATAAPMRNVVPETVVPPPQAKQAAEAPEASVEPPAPVATPAPIEAPERRPAVETQIKKPEPAKASVRKPAPTETAARKPTPAAPKVAAVQPTAAPAPRAAARPRAPAGRNSPQAAARARDAIAAMRRDQARAVGVNANQAIGGIADRIQDIQMQAYYGRVRVLITNAWHLPMMQQTAQTLQAVALLTIDREGQVIRYQLLRSSGSPPFDASLHRAVQASLPLPPLPATFSKEILEFEFHFTPPASS